jgi:membrane protein YdbS with pleckstrin-like domain
LDNLLLVVAQTGVLIYSIFCMIGAFFQMSQHSMAFLAALATIVQTLLQTIFILDASNR